MRFSRLGILVLLTITVLIGANCGYYNRIIARKNLVDGSKAYKDRKFEQAEEFFRQAVARDPKGESVEGKTAQLFLARTLHSEYIGNRSNTAKAEEAIKEYQKALVVDPNDQSSYKAIASLYENLQRTDDWKNWVTERSKNESIKPEHRAEALVSLAAKQNTCANDITDTEATKKTVTRDGKQAFQFVKPADGAEFEKLKGCVKEGLVLIDQALALQPEAVKNATALDVKSLTDAQLKSNSELMRVFESARSYKASLLIQDMRTADMEGRTDDFNRLKDESESARTEFTNLSNKVKEIQTEVDARLAAKEEAESGKSKANAKASQ